MTEENKRGIEVIDLNKDFNASARRITELKNNRHVNDIPLNDDYWKAIKKHMKYHGGNS